MKDRIQRNLNEFDNSKIESLSDEERLHITRHSSSHVLAMAVLRLFPDAQPATGPSIDNRFVFRG